MGECTTLARVRDILWPPDAPRLTYRDRKAAALDTLEAVEQVMVRGGWGPLPQPGPGGSTPGRQPEPPLTPAEIADDAAIEELADSTHAGEAGGWQSKEA